MTWTSVIAFVPTHNAKGKKDVTGAFLPEAKHFLDLAGGEGKKDLHRFDNRKPMRARAAQVLQILAEYRSQRRKVLAVAFFCHGWKNGIQAGFTSSAKRATRIPTVDVLARAIASITGSGAIVPLYCCSTAASSTRGAPGGDGGFADELRDALCRHGADNNRVDAHTSVKHTTMNPDVRRFEGRGSPIGGTGGQFLIAPGTKYRKAWVKALRETNTRLLFPWWDTGLVTQHLA